MSNQMLEDLSIFQLRELARNIGVFSPTILKKAELIQSINDIKSGKIKPHIANTRQGRPPKKINGLGDIVGIFLPSNLDNLKTKEESIFDRNDENSLNLFQNPNEPSDFDEIIVFNGFLELMENGSALIKKKFERIENIENIVYVPETIVNELGLRSGDEILCKAYITTPGRPMYVGQIMSINDQELNSFNKSRINIDECKSDFNNIFNYSIKKGNKEIKLKWGDFCFCYSENSIDFKYFISKFMVDAKENYDKIIYLCPNIKESEFQILQGLPAEMHCIKFDENYSVQKRNAFLALNRTKRLAELGQNVCFIIDDITAIMAFDAYANGELPITKYILSQSKKMEQGSITIICNMPKIPQINIRNILFATFNSIETVGLVLNDRDIDLDKSYRK